MTTQGAIECCFGNVSYRPAIISPCKDKNARRVEEDELPERGRQEEMRANLLRKLASGETIFPGIIGFDIPCASDCKHPLRHNFILLDCVDRPRAASCVRWSTCWTRRSVYRGMRNQ